MRSPSVQFKKPGQYDELASKFFGLALMLLCPIVMPYDAYGDCTGDTAGLFTSLGGTGFSKCVAGQLGIFANILCTFEQTMQTLLSQMYCSFQTQLKSPVASALSLAMVVFGACVFTGYIKLTVAETLKAVVKLALVWTFAMNADYGILWVGKFFMGVLEEGSNIAVTPIGGNVTLTQPDSVIQGFFNYMSNPTASVLTASGGPNDCSGMGNPTADCMNSTVLRNFSSCAAFLMVAAVGLLAFMPVVLMFMLTVLFQYVALYVKAVLGYLTSIVILTFLLIFSPLFLSFALFGVTKNLFSRWLQFLQAFSLQAVILFAFVALLGLVTQGFTVFLYGLMGLLRPYDVAFSHENLTITTPNACSICEYQITTLPNGIQTIQCLPALNVSALATGVPPREIDTLNFPPNPGASDSTATWPNDVQGNAISYYPNHKQLLGDVLSSQVNFMPEDATQNGGSNYVIPILSVLTRADFVIYIVANVIAFIVIAHIFQEFIDKAPALAKALAGASVPGLLGGTGGSDSIRYLGAEAFKASMVGMEANMLRDPFDASKNVFTRMREGLVGRKVIADESKFTTHAAYMAALAAAPTEGGAFGAFFGGTESNNAAGAAYEDNVKTAQLNVDQADKKLDDAQSNAVKMGAEFEAKKQALEAEQAKANKDQMAIATKAKELNSAATAYEKAIQDVEDQRLLLSRRKRDLKAAIANMQGSATRLRGVGAQFDENGNVIGGGIRDDLSSGANDQESRYQRDENGRLVPVGAEADRYNTRMSARNDAADEDSRADKARAEVRAAAMAQVAKRDYSILPPSSGFSSNSSSRMIEANQNTTEKLDTLDKEMKAYGGYLKDDQRKEYQATIDKARADLGKAKTTKEVEDIQKNIAGVEQAFDQYSSKNIMQGAALAGIAGVTGLAVLASQTTPSSYMQKANQSIDGAKDGMKNASSTQDYSKVYDQATQSTSPILDALLNAMGIQQSMAGRVLSKDELAAIDAKKKEADDAAAAAKTPEEKAAVIRKYGGSASDTVEAIFAAFGTQRETAAMLVPEQSLKNYDQKIADAKTDASYAQTGDDYMKVIQSMLAAPMALIDGISEGMQLRADAANMTPEERQRLEESLKEHKATVNNSMSGDTIQSVLDSLQDVGTKINDGMMGVTVTKRDESAGNDEAYKSQLQKTKEAVDAINAKKPSGISGALADRKYWAERDKANPQPVTWQHHSEVLGSSADNGVPSAWQDFKGRVSGAVPDFSKTKFEEHSEVLGSSADNGIGNAVKETGNKIQDAAPNFSNTKFETHGEVLGSSTDNGIGNAVKATGNRIEGAAPDFSNTKFEAHGEVLGSSTDNGIGNAVKDTGSKIEDAAEPRNLSNLEWQASANVLGQNVALPSLGSGSSSATPATPASPAEYTYPITDSKPTADSRPATGSKPAADTTPITESTDTVSRPPVTPVSEPAVASQAEEQRRTPPKLNFDNDHEDALREGLKLRENADRRDDGQPPLSDSEIDKINHMNKVELLAAMHTYKNQGDDDYNFWFQLRDYAKEHGYEVPPSVEDGVERGNRAAAEGSRVAAAAAAASTYADDGARRSKGIEADAYAGPVINRSQGFGLTPDAQARTDASAHPRDQMTPQVQQVAEPVFGHPAQTQSQLDRIAEDERIQAAADIREAEEKARLDKQNKENGA